MGLATEWITMTPRIVYWNNIPAPYMVERFNAVARNGNLALEVWFSERTERDRSWIVEEDQWEFDHRYLPGMTCGRHRLALPVPLLHGDTPDLLVSLYAGPSFLLGWTLAKRRGVRIAFWAEVTYDAWVSRRRWKEAIKSFVFPRVDAILTAGDDGRAFVRGYGTRDDRIFNVPHVIDFAHYRKGSALSPAQRSRLRAELGLRGVTFLYVGRLWTGKGLMYLLDAFRQLQLAGLEETTLLLVGDGPDEELLRESSQTASSGNVVFAGFYQVDRLPHLYAAADVFVFPTLGDPFGLVVPEAMACGLPVIATKATGEIHGRVEDGINGFIVRPGNTQDLLERMNLLARDPDLRARMGEASVQKVVGQTPGAWAEAFERAVDRILSMPPLEADEPISGGAVRGVTSGGKD
jgi:glycosyltransferase involved in cell wall biosynthesis